MHHPRKGQALAETSLLDGWLPWTLRVLALLALGYLLARRPRWWWLIAVPTCLAVALLVAWLIAFPLSRSLIGQDMHTEDFWWLVVICFALALAVASMLRSGYTRKLLAVPAALVVFLAGTNQINVAYAQYPTLGDVLGVTDAAQIDGPPNIAGSTYAPLPGGPLATVWQPTGPDIPAAGVVSDITLPGTTSGFPARPGKVYYPPAYFASDPQPLPVLVLMSGQPGGPDDWLLGNRLQQVMDPWAAGNRGIAPVVVVVDQLGTAAPNPACVDSPLGQADTYLAVDVPAGITQQLRVQTDHAHWAVGGFSNGGTCAVQMAFNHPDVYPSFISLGGEEGPTVGANEAESIQNLFGGDAAKYRAINPLDLMQTGKFPTVSGWLVYGAGDVVIGPGQDKLYAAARAAGLDVQKYVVPDTSHDWNMVTGGLTHVLPWLGRRMGITG